MEGNEVEVSSALRFRSWTAGREAGQSSSRLRRLRLTIRAVEVVTGHVRSAAAGRRSVPQCHAHGRFNIRILELTRTQISAEQRTSTPSWR